MVQKPNQRGATRESIKATKHHWPTRRSFSPTKYFRQHQETLTESFMRLVSYPLASIMTVMVIAIALSLPGGLYVLLKNVQSVTDQWEQQSVITLYLFSNLEDTQALALSHRLSALDNVASVEYISKEEGLRYFEQSSGYEQIMSSLPENPLPIVLRVIPTLTVDVNTLASLQALRDQLAAQKEVEYAELDAQWLQRLANILSFGQRFVYALSVLLIVAVFLIVGNTIRMAVESRRDEVLVMKLVGATDAYIRRPFLYMGLWFGLLGGLFASLCILLLSWWVSAPAERLIELYQSGFQLQTFNADEIILCLTISALVGVVGAWIAVSRHISNIELQ
ncbi:MULTISPECIES: permease-like cell division protein FtsX [Marinomonas]|uniref:Cell division protein FtsX n=1 Tax=Marinomonas arctica TaxID=383750 RepID=A0A7H1J621_9GAMM|nr:MULTISPECIES: permease-like cell division protein FtsX [Marinomonas]MCS7484927.1 cell division protein FtsX [Marinomonas sp. BSi20414]QNT05937.1 cell division protein FtsX [Marinomonas arctica]GGN20069.1 cell division protein FtsX [Marinomonas arctica]